MGTVSEDTQTPPDEANPSNALSSEVGFTQAEQWKMMFELQQRSMMQLIEAMKTPSASLTTLPEFNPDLKEADARAWCSAIDVCMTEKPLEGGALILVLSKSLKGSAAPWLSQVAHAGMTWQYFKDLFLARFACSETVAATIIGINNSRPKDEECLAAYASRLINTLVPKWKDMTPEEIAISYVFAHTSQFDNRIHHLAYTKEISTRSNLLQELKSFSTLKRKSERESPLDAKRFKYPRPDVCIYCKKVGHKINDCRKRSFKMNSNTAVGASTSGTNSSSTSASTMKKSVICFTCGEKGHIATHCPKSIPRRSPVGNSASGAISSNAVGDGGQQRRRVDYYEVQGASGMLEHSVNLSCFTHGCSTGWVSGVLGREALTGGAWLAALPCLVALPTAPFFAFLADAKGRKAGALCICLSFIVSWSLAAWCGPRGVWAARVAAGAGGAGALALAPLYCAEISPRTKGLAAMPALAISCGILFAFIAGGILSAHALSLSMAAPPTVLLVSLVWLPETPSFLISVGRMQDAAKVICWLDGSDFREDLTDAIEQQEVMIRTEPARRGSDALQPMLRRSRSEGTSEGTEQSACRNLFRHRRSRRALLSCCLLLAAAAGSGAGAVNSFAAAVLAHSGHALPALNLTAYNFTVYNGSMSRGWRQTSETGSVLCGTALVLGAAVATVTVDRLGRKVLLLISCVGIAFCLTILGLYCDPRAHMYSWYPHRLWPYRKPGSVKEKTHSNLTIENISKDALTSISNTRLFHKASLENETVAEISIRTAKSEVNGSIEVSSLEFGQDTAERHEEVSIWPPVILLSMVVFLYNIGLGSVPYVLISELFSINVRSLASSLLISWMWLSSFFTLRYFGPLALTVGLHGTYYIGASITLLISGYIYFMLPETKGKNQKQIDDLLNGPLLVHLKKKRKTNET